MPKSKLIVADPETGRSTMYEMNDDQFRAFRGLRIGSEVDGSTVGVEGKMKITGGSDSAGFPMRGDVLGGVKKYVLLTKGVGFRTKEKGLKRRKLVRGNTITDEIYQINAVLTSKPKKTKKKAPKQKKAPKEEKEAAPKEGKEAPKKEEAKIEKGAKKEQKAEPPKKKPPQKTAGKQKRSQRAAPRNRAGQKS